MKVLLIAPHQDDEVLAAGGLMHRMQKNGDHVSVLFATNGDYHGPEVALLRYYESYKALNHLGIRKDNIFYLGYGDTGMCDSHSFLRKLQFADKEFPLATPFSIKTYHPGMELTVHALRTGEESLLNHEEFLADLTWFIHQYRPDLLIFPHPKDQHGDHAAIFAFLKEANIFAHIPICLTYIIHGGNDMTWPPRDQATFLCPPVITANIWEKRISVALTNTEMQRKIQALQFFESQISADATGFLKSFCKQEEVFFLLTKDNISQQNR